MILITQPYNLVDWEVQEQESNMWDEDWDDDALDDEYARRLK